VGNFRGGFAEVEPVAGTRSSTSKPKPAGPNKKEEDSPKGCLVLILAVVGLLCFLACGL